MGFGLVRAYPSGSRNWTASEGRNFMRKLLIALPVMLLMSGLSQESYAISDQAAGGELSGSDCPINYHYNRTTKNCDPDAIKKRHDTVAPAKSDVGKRPADGTYTTTAPAPATTPSPQYQQNSDPQNARLVGLGGWDDERRKACTDKGGKVATDKEGRQICQGYQPRSKAPTSAPATSPQ